MKEKRMGKTMKTIMPIPKPIILVLITIGIITVGYTSSYNSQKKFPSSVNDLIPMLVATSSEEIIYVRFRSEKNKRPHHEPKNNKNNLGAPSGFPSPILVSDGKALVR